MTAVDTSVKDDYLSRIPTADEEERARLLQRDAIILDTCGSVRPNNAAMIDDSIAILKQNHINAMALTLVAEEDDTRGAMNMIMKWNKLIRQHSHHLVKVQSAAEIRQAKEDGRIGIWYQFQNGRPFDDDEGNVELFRDMGVTQSQLTYNTRTFLGDGGSEPENAGLSNLGRRVIEEMNRVGILIDLAHSGDRTRLQTIEHSAMPVLMSHCATFGINGEQGNITDEILERANEKGGVISIPPLSLASGRIPTVADMGEHIEYALAKMGPSGVGFATDYPKGRPLIYEAAHLDENGYLHLQHDGTTKARVAKWEGRGHLMEYPWYQYAEGMTTYNEFPNLVRELVVRGLDDETILAVLGGNVLSLYEKVVG
ncbi:membrane dipeptidase [Microbacterium sp. ASV81]|uniref:Membrane dipeptidase n=1 Tax=Microbacterium capsulatum TaxID=3041921 RepID=A0ABU0XHA7_9MICO|nr:membrane dipeptidase [Microbacterium sp. ASV81]MDQ4213080.1 membrane dipeptidase [Microbacterium sp. ASV81]